MTRFALIPLAFFANACASAEEVQDLVEETTEEVREGIDGVDYSKTSNAETLLAQAQKQFRKEMDVADCEMVGALAGKVTNPNTIQMVIVDTASESVIAKLRGSMSLETNHNGAFYAQDTTMSPFRSIRIDGDWDHNAVEADVFMTQGRNNHEATLFATMTERGDASSIVGAIAVCD